MIYEKRYKYILVACPYNCTDIHTGVMNLELWSLTSLSTRSALLVEETRVPGENHRPVASHWQTLSHNVVSSSPRYKRDSNSQL